MQDIDLKSEISKRLEQLIVTKLGEEKNFYAALERTTGVDRETWKHWYLKPNVVDPSVKLLKSAFELWPEHAFWLSTGLTDVGAGHVAPDDKMNEFLTTQPDHEKIKKVKVATKYYWDCLEQLQVGPTEDKDHQIAVVHFARMRRDSLMSTLLDQGKDGD